MTETPTETNETTNSSQWYLFLNLRVHVLIITSITCFKLNLACLSVTSVCLSKSSLSSWLLGVALVWHYSQHLQDTYRTPSSFLQYTSIQHTCATSQMHHQTAHGYSKQQSPRKWIHPRVCNQIVLMQGHWSFASCHSDRYIVQAIHSSPNCLILGQIREGLYFKMYKCYLISGYTLSNLLLQYTYTYQ